MSKHSTVSGPVSPLVWLIPLPFLLAMCLPVDLPAATAQQRRCRSRRHGTRAVQPQDTAASAAQRPPR